VGELLYDSLRDGFSAYKLRKLKEREEQQEKERKERVRRLQQRASASPQVPVTVQ
jgi:hypothetical protein